MLEGIIFVAFAYLAFKFITGNLNYWRKQGVPGPAPIPLIGNFPTRITRKKHMAQEFAEIYDKYRSNRFIGVFEFTAPSIIIIDPELVKEVIINKFTNFHDNAFAQLINKESDPIFGRNPFMLSGEEWKEKRNEVVPAFTTGRIKALFSLIEHAGSLMTSYLRRNIQNGEPIDTRELCAKFTTEAVSSSIFGADSGVFTRESSEIREMGRKLINNNFLFFVKIMIVSFFPWILNFYKIRFIPKQVEVFFTQVMKNAYEQRKQSQIDQKDYLDYLIQLKEKSGISELEMAAHGVTFFIDGYETSSLAIAHTLFELSRSELIQNKLRREITETIEKNGKVTYEYLAGDSYLDQVFHEALRLHPPVVVLSRQVTEETELSLTDEDKIKCEKNIIVTIPVWSIHRDPAYYDEPEKFHPERFDPENGGVKKFRDQGVFLAFGNGPRICLGQRFALIQSKSCIVEVIRNFQLTLNTKTQTPLVIDPKEFLNIPVGGIWIDFKEIK